MTTAFAPAIEALLATLPPVEATDDPAVLLAYSHDAFPLGLKAAGEGRAYRLPATVAFPADVAEVQHVVKTAARFDVPVVPFGGGSGIVGGALASAGWLTVELKRLSGIHELDETSLLVTVGAGTNGQLLEDALNERGLTTGHYPQSLRSSTVGGWIAHRACGTASTKYGGIEALVAGLEVVLPGGELLSLRPVPRTSTGPDLRQWFLGAEGAAGIVTSATLRIFRLPTAREWLVFNPATLGEGLDFVRRLLQLPVRPAVVRLYDEAETADRFPEAIGSILLLECEGDAQLVEYEAARIRALARERGLATASSELAEQWWERRFDTPGLLRPLLEPAGIADALEVAAAWSLLPTVYPAMLEAMERAFAGAPHRIATHLSHAYADGANLYVIFSADAAAAERVEPLYRRVVHEALTACAAAGGTISHHHGIGIAKADVLRAELGDAGLDLLSDWRRAVDPDRRFSREKLTDDCAD